MFAGGKRLSPTEPTGETVAPYTPYRGACVGADMTARMKRNMVLIRGRMISAPTHIFRQIVANAA